MLKKFTLLCICLALTSCGYDMLEVRQGTGGIGSTVTDDDVDEDTDKPAPSDEFCQEIEYMTCDDLSVLKNEDITCVMAQQIYACGYTGLDRDDDGFMCENVFYGTCKAPTNINYGWRDRLGS